MYYNNAVSDNCSLFNLCLIILGCFDYSAENKIDKQELIFLMTGGVSIKNNIPNPGPNWLLNKSWDEICCLDELIAYNGLITY